MTVSAKKELSDRVKDIGKRLGFHIVRITNAEPSSDYMHYQRWIQRDMHADMHYLKKHLEKKSDPKKVLPSVKSIICCALSYHTSDEHPMNAKEGHGLISNYAWGDDYHKIIEKKLKAYVAELHKLIPNIEARAYVDTGPILERSLAERAGIGWIAKNTCVINREYGSYIFLAEILVNIDLSEDETETDQCGSCTKCLDACPTNALLGAYQMDANKCISYLTIEKRGAFSDDQKKMLGDHIFGCDICQQVCPWNEQAHIPDLADFKARKGFTHPKLDALGAITPEAFSQTFSKSPIKRTKVEGLRRNIDGILL